MGSSVRRKIAFVTALAVFTGALAGCGDKDKALDTAAAPPGEKAVTNPPTKAPGDRAGRPPVFPGGK